MSNVHRIFGAELSPYSVKVRSYFRYKRIPHEWLLRSSANQAEFDKYARLPLIPLVVTPEGKGLQDSTPIIEHFEALFPEPSIHPSDADAAFLSALIEEYADEWGNKPMFHYRWFYEADQQSGGERIARTMMPDLPEDQLAGVTAMVKERMIPRLKLVGSSPETKDLIEASFERQLAILEKHLARRNYLFGNRPAFADFGLYAQLYQSSIDPTPGALMKRTAPTTLAWIERMLDPKAEGDFETWESLEPTLMPFLTEEVGRTFLPWSLANESALAAGEKTFAVTLRGRPFSQETQKYHARSLGALRERYARLADRTRLDPILKAAGCYEALQPRG